MCVAQARRSRAEDDFDPSEDGEVPAERMTAEGRRAMALTEGRGSGSDDLFRRSGRGLRRRKDDAIDGADDLSDDEDMADEADHSS